MYFMEPNTLLPYHLPEAPQTKVVQTVLVNQISLYSTALDHRVSGDTVLGGTYVTSSCIHHT